MKDEAIARQKKEALDRINRKKIEEQSKKSASDLAEM